MKTNQNTNDIELKPGEAVTSETIEELSNGKGGNTVDNKQIKKLLELLEKALTCENVATITITIKPNQKPKQ